MVAGSAIGQPNCRETAGGCGCADLFTRGGEFAAPVATKGCPQAHFCLRSRSLLRDRGHLRRIRAVARDSRQVRPPRRVKSAVETTFIRLHDCDALQAIR
jgi:hypothetical protein